MGQNDFTRNWTAGFSPRFHLPGFHFGYLFLTHSQSKDPLVAVRTFGDTLFQDLHRGVWLNWVKPAKAFGR